MKKVKALFRLLFAKNWCLTTDSRVVMYGTFGAVGNQLFEAVQLYNEQANCESAVDEVNNILNKQTR